MISIRKLAAVDMLWLGARIVLAEYALGVILPLLLGVLSIRSGLFGPVFKRREFGFGIWLVGIAANYVPLLIYAARIAKAGTVKAEGEPELVRAKRYGLQQVIILIPCLVIVVALVQELRRR
jgi:hypothetical protein